MHASIFAFLATPVSAMALCLNPFGCEPKTEAECVKEAASAKTEAAAKALIAECRKLPRVTLSQCKVAERRWAEHLGSRAGVEWDWSERSTKSECKKHFPDTFAPALWVTPYYCKENAERLAQAAVEVDSITLKSARLEQARRKTPELDGLDDWQAISVLQAVYYSGMSKTDLATRTFVDAPPDPLAVAAECRKLSPQPPAVVGMTAPPEVRKQGIGAAVEKAIAYVISDSPGKPVSETTILTADMLPKISSRINEQLPMTVDRDTQLDSTFGGPGLRFTYFYTTPGRATLEIDVPAFKRDMSNRLSAGVCSGMPLFVRSGITMVYTYRAKDGRVFTNIEVPASSCK